MDLQQAYDQLHELLKECGDASDFEALDTLWIATGKADNLIARSQLTDQHSRTLRKQQGRTEGGC